MMDLDLLEWEEIACGWCGSPETDLIFQGPDRLEGLPGTFSLVRCKACGLFRQSPRLVWQSLQGYYPEAYAAYVADEITNLPAWKLFIQQYGNRKRRRAIESYQAGGRLLEIGCGTGSFLEELTRSGKWDAIGIEPSPYAASIAKKKLKTPIYQGKFTQIPLEASSFDVIALWYVLEHLEDPSEDLHRVSRLLKKGGWLIFSIPNIASIEARIFKQYWAGWDLPRHLYVFPRPLLHQILNSLGFRVVAESCLSSGHALLGNSLDFWSQSWQDRHPRIKRTMMAAYYSWLSRVLLAIPLKILDSFRLTTTITIFAQKN